MPNVFENNEPNTDREDHEELGSRAHVLLPPLDKGYRYDFKSLKSGKTAVVIEADADLPEIHPEQELTGDDLLNTPESRTLRHAD